MKQATHYTWDRIPKERMTAQIDRRFVHGERAMVAHLQDGEAPPDRHERQQDEECCPPHRHQPLAPPLSRGMASPSGKLRSTR